MTREQIALLLKNRHLTADARERLLQHLFHLDEQQRNKREASKKNFRGTTQQTSS